MKRAIQITISFHNYKRPRETNVTCSATDIEATPELLTVNASFVNISPVPALAPFPFPVEEDADRERDEDVKNGGFHFYIIRFL